MEKHETIIGCAGALATICGGILTPLINVISGIPVIGSQLATICGSLASALGCIA